MLRKSRIAVAKVGKRVEPVFLGAAIAVEAYQTVDVYTAYRFSETVKAFADLKNITNKQFFDVYRYNARRFTFVAGLNVNL